MRESVGAPTRGTGRTRRQVLGLTGASVGLALSGALTSCRLRWDTDETHEPPAPTADQIARARAADGARALVELVSAIQVVRPAAKTRLAPLAELHRQHLIALGAPVPSVGSPSSATTAPATAPPTTPGTTSGSPGATGGTPPAAPSAGTTGTTPALTAANAMATLSRAEKDEAVRIRAELPDVSGDLARILASIAACCDVLSGLALSPTMTKASP